MSKSNYLEDKTLNHIFGKEAYAAPTIYVALWTATLTDASTGSTAGECEGGDYERVETAPADWTKAGTGPGEVQGEISNATAIIFPTASAAWGTATHFGLLDAATDGNMLHHEALNAPREVAEGATPTFAIGSLVVTED